MGHNLKQKICTFLLRRVRRGPCVGRGLAHSNRARPVQSDLGPEVAQGSVESHRKIEHSHDRPKLKK